MIRRTLLAFGILLLLLFAYGSITGGKIAKEMEAEQQRIQQEQRVRDMKQQLNRGLSNPIKDLNLNR